MKMWRLLNHMLPTEVIWRDAVLPNMDRTTQQSVPALLPLASGLVQWSLKGVSRHWGHTWAQQPELLHIKANRATDCVRWPSSAGNRDQCWAPWGTQQPLVASNFCLFHFRKRSELSLIEWTRILDTSMCFQAACPQPASLLKDLQRVWSAHTGGST